MQRVQKTVSILLAALMVLSLFAAIPITVGATYYGDGAVIYASSLQAGDIVGCDIGSFYRDRDIILKGGTYCNTDDFEVCHSDLTLNENNYVDFAVGFGAFIDIDEKNYYPSEANRESSEKWIVLDTDDTSVTLAGHIPGTVYNSDSHIFTELQPGDYITAGAMFGPGTETAVVLRGGTVCVKDGPDDLTVIDSDVSVNDNLYYLSDDNGQVHIFYVVDNSMYFPYANGDIANAFYVESADSDVITLIGAMLPSPASSSPFTYTVLGDDTANITGYTGTDTDVTIPGEIDGHTVTSIGDEAFKDNDDITNVIIPASVTSIGMLAFSNCSSLQCVTFVRPSEEGTLTLGTAPFDGCAVSYSGDGDYALFDGDTEIKQGDLLREKENVTLTWKEPVNKTVELNLNGDNATVTWKDRCSTLGFWSLVARTDDIDIQLMNNQSSQAAGSYTWADMDRISCIYIFKQPYSKHYFTDGSCTVTVNKGIVTLTGAFTGDDGKTYALTISNASTTPTEAPTEAPTETPTETPTEAPSRFVNHSLTLNGDIGVNFYVNLNDEEKVDSQVVFTWDGNSAQTKTLIVPFSEAKDTENGVRFTCPISAAEMNDTITAQLYIDGELISTDLYSARLYADVILSNSDWIATYKDKEGANKYNDLATLVKTMLNYGASAQTQFVHNTDNPANTGIGYPVDPLTDDELNAIPVILPKKVDVDVSEYGLSYYGASLLLKTKTTLRFYFEIADPEKYNAEDISLGSITEVKPYRDGTKYVYIEAVGIAANDLDKTYVLSVGNTTIGEYSALSYVKDVLTDGETGSPLTDTVTALYRFHKAAKAYFAIPEPGPDETDIRPGN